MPTVTITQEKTAKTSRQDLKLRMSSRRRLPHPSTSSSSTGQPQNTIGQAPRVILTYSEFLGNFDTVPLSFNGDYRHRPSFGTPLTETHDAFGTGTSRAHSGFYPTTEADPDYAVENRWTKDMFGRDHWVGHGKIEEVDEDVALASSTGAKSKGKGRANAFSTSSKVANVEYDLNGFRAEEIPFISSPPPGPRPKKLTSLRPTPTGSDYHSFKATPTVVPAMQVPVNASNSSPVLDDEAEVSLVKENLDLLALSQEDVKFMNTVRSSTVLLGGDHLQAYLNVFCLPVFPRKKS